MTQDEVAKTLKAARDHVPGLGQIWVMATLNPDDFTVLVPVRGQRDLWYVLTEYHVNIFEDLRAIDSVPDIERHVLLGPPTSGADDWTADDEAATP